MKSKESQVDFDLVIIGGAMAGATLALALSKLTQNKLNIALVEAVSINHEHQGFDARSIALSFGSCALLNKFDLWQPLSPFATPINHIHVSNKGYVGITEMHADSANLPYLGQVIELNDAGQILYQKLNQTPNIQLFCPAKVTGIESHVSFRQIKLDNGEKFSTKLVVAADGGLSSSAEMLGIARSEHDFHQTAIISNVTTSKAHECRAFERFTSQGPVALLPMTRDRSSLVWCCSSKQAEQIMTLDKEAFLDKLQQIFGWRLGKFKQCSIPNSYPLILRQSSRLITHRAVMVGNAAQTLHPIAGQGFNLAMRDIATLAVDIASAYKTKQDWGAMPVLQAYRAKREQDRNTTIGLISGLVYGFSNQSLSLAALRNASLMAMSNCEKIKAPLMRQMMGLKYEI